jgi:hypothetical protein
MWAEVAPLEVGRKGVAATMFRDLIWVAVGMTAAMKNPLCRNADCCDGQHTVQALLQTAGVYTGMA